MKKFIKGLSVLGLALSLTATPSISNAAQEEPLATNELVYDLSQVDQQLVKKLKKAGFTELQISTLSPEVLQDLKATKILKKLNKEVIEKGEIVKDPNTGEEIKTIQYKKGAISIQSTGNLNMSLTTDAWEVTSDRTGETKIILVSNYNWNEVPMSRFTDALSIGFPSSSSWYLPTTSSDDVAQFYANDYYVNDANPYDVTYRYINTSTPDAAEPNAGVGHEIDLPGVLTVLDFYGGMQQYVYVDNDKLADTNIKTVYGHSTVSISPSFGVYPAGFTVEPGYSIVEEYAIETFYN